MTTTAVSVPPGVTVTVSYEGSKWVEARITRVDRLGLGFVELTGTAPKYYAFTFDRLIGYRGEPLKEFGLHEGRLVHILLKDDRVELVSLTGIPSANIGGTDA